MNLIAAIVVSILGAAIGSFLSVVIHRLKTKKGGTILSRSFCPACKEKIRWNHLIPIFSWIFLRGKCAYCKKTISFHYIMLEIIMGGLFLLAFLNWNFINVIPSTVNADFFSYSINWQTFQTFIFYIIEFTFLMAIFMYDLLHKEIPDRFSIPAVGIAIIGGLILGFPTPMSMLIGGAVIFSFFFLQILVSGGKWIGGGDLRLGVLMGVLLGWKLGLLALVLAYFIGAIFSIFALASGKLTRKSAIPFGPFLVTGTIVVIFHGEQILRWYLETLVY